jgi:hypothetical protein
MCDASVCGFEVDDILDEPGERFGNLFVADRGTIE